ncbi:MAG: methyltransferase domain-containing protein [Pyrinomonadaceae bacterium]|nr:methyltransferase domain-containing protein [Pyrinomonadaceae bacterium]MCX7639637.1 methyltransferase domain-containing protein [Pyrinomonadaceae bacterium]MDW8303345.1 transcription antitermination factor NusB [Acidobacteriota bacterium]
MKRIHNISPARFVALKALKRIERDKAFSSILLSQLETNLSEKDKALCHELCLGVLRRKMLLDAIIDRLAEGKSIDLDIRIILRLGIYQIAFLDKIPTHAAVDEAVKMAVKCGKPQAKGFVNAILRRYSSTKSFSFDIEDEIEKVSLYTSHPKFLIERWSKQFGFETARLIAETNNKLIRLEARFTAKTSRDTKQQLRNLTTLELLDLASKGEIYFQDKASQLVANAVQLRADESFLDVCCAPGSKFTFIHYLLACSPKKLFVGSDRFFHRLEITKKNCERLGVENYCLVCCDAESALPFGEESFDVVLLDAPCSGTGTIRNNPEIRYFLRESDFLELQQKQIKMMREALRVLKKGGRLIYSTCSLEREENEDVVREILAEFPNLKKHLLENMKEFLTDEGFYRTFPHRDDMGGFFFSVLKKF